MRSLRSQLSLTIMIIILFTVAVISFLSNFFINREFKRYIVGQQNQKIAEIVSILCCQYDGPSEEWNTEYIHGIGMYALYDGYILKVYDNDGITVWDAENHDMALCEQIMHDIEVRMEKKCRHIRGIFSVHDYDLIHHGQKIGTAAIRYYGPYFLSESDFHFLDTLNFILIFIGILSLSVSFIISGILAGHIARPVTKTAYIAKQISEGNYSIRFEGKTKSKEIEELVSAVNYLAAALDNQENMRKRLTVDIAHELRTPLTTLSSHLEAMMEGVWEPSTERLQSCCEEIGRLAGLVKDLGRLSETESEHLILYKTYSNIMDIVRLACKNFEMEIKKKNLSLMIEGEDSFVHADKDRLGQVMTNLLSNAVKYVHENGTIRIEVKDSEKEGVLIIEDDGIGIPEHELPLIFERFYRTDKSRNRKTGGAGIGLAIVKSIVTAHGGTVEAKSREEGGSRFIVILPKE